MSQNESVSEATLKKVCFKPNGDFRIIEMNDGTLVHLGNMSALDYWNSLKHRLSDVEEDESRMDMALRYFDRVPPTVSEISLNHDSTGFVLTSIDGEEFELTPQEMKTILYQA